jgi:hypothetical protein
LPWPANAQCAGSRPDLAEFSISRIFGSAQPEDAMKSLSKEEAAMLHIIE